MAQPRLERTYVMAYWPIASNAKRSLDHYTKHMALSLEMLAGENLYFISGNNSILASVEELCRKNNINLHVDKLLLDDLARQSSMEGLLDCAKRFGARLRAPPADFQNDKGLIHYWRDLRQAGEDAFRKIFCIWHSKIDLLHKAATLNPFSSDQFAWVDASVSRFNHRRPGWDFREIAEVTPGVIHHFPNDMRKNGRRLSLNASFLIGDRQAIDRLHSEYEEAFARCLEEDYPNDEETVIDAIVSREPQLFSVISGVATALSSVPPSLNPPVAVPPLGTGAEATHALHPASGPKKVLVVGVFRSGTNAMKACLEEHYDVDVTFNEWFWKHGLPPTGIQNPVPPDVPIVVMVKSPFAFHESLYPFWQHRRPNLDSGPDVSSFARKELLVFDVSGGDFSRPKYCYRSPIEYWNQFYFSWLSWTEVQPRCQFVRYESLEGDAEREILSLAKRFKLRRKKPGPISLPDSRVGPHVPTERKGERFTLTDDARQWIRERVDSRVSRTFHYEL